MKLFVYLMTALMVTGTVEAKKKGNERAKQEEAQKQKERQEREEKRDAVKAVLKDKDKNRDGSLTKDEFIAGEADPEAAGKRFDEFNKNKDRYLTKSEIADMLGI